MPHSHLQSLTHYLRDADVLDPAQFAKRHPEPCLLFWATPHRSLPAPGFHTSAVDPVTNDPAKFALCDEYRVLRLMKAPGNPWSERISIGRARNNDIVVRLPSVSKLHGHFIDREGAPFFCDVGSRNGSRLNGASLREREFYPVSDGDALSLGHVDLAFHTSTGLHAYLQTFL